MIFSLPRLKPSKFQARRKHPMLIVRGRETCQSVRPPKETVLGSAHAVDHFQTDDQSLMLFQAEMGRPRFDSIILPILPVDRPQHKSEGYP